MIWSLWLSDRPVWYMHLALDKLTNPPTGLVGNSVVSFSSQSLAQALLQTPLSSREWPSNWAFAKKLCHHLTLSLKILKHKLKQLHSLAFWPGKSIWGSRARQPPVQPKPLLKVLQRVGSNEILCESPSGLAIALRGSYGSSWCWCQCEGN